MTPKLCLILFHWDSMKFVWIFLITNSMEWLIHLWENPWFLSLLWDWKLSVIKRIRELGNIRTFQMIIEKRTSLVLLGPITINRFSFVSLQWKSRTHTWFHRCIIWILIVVKQTLINLYDDSITLKLVTNQIWIRFIISNLILNMIGGKIVWNNPFKITIYKSYRWAKDFSGFKKINFQKKFVP